MSLKRVGFLLLLAAWACAPDDGPGAIPADDAGAPLVLSGSPGRIVSLAPSLTEMLFAIGAGPRVVGRTDWGSYPSEALDVASVGAGLSPNVELVASRRPDLVLFYSSNANAPAIAQLAALGVPSFSFRTDSLGDVARVATILGDLLGLTSLTDTLAAGFSSWLQAARLEAAANPPRCDAAIIVWDSPPMVIGRGSFLTELIELAGGRNVFDDIAGPDAEVSVEAIAARDPEVIVTLGDAAPAYAGREEWQVVAAVRARAFVPISGSRFEYPSFRSLEAVAHLRSLLADCGR